MFKSSLKKKFAPTVGQIIFATGVQKTSRFQKTHWPGGWRGEAGRIVAESSFGIEFFL